MFQRKRFFVSGITAALLVVPLTACASFDRGKMAKEVNNRAAADLDAMDGKSSVDHANEAMELLDPFVQHPELLPLEYEQGVSFDAAPPRLTSVSPHDIEQTLARIASAYETAGDWNKACVIRLKAIEFADGWNKSHADKNKNHGVYLVPYDFVSLYTDYARVLQRAGDKGKANQYCRMALDQLTQAVQAGDDSMRGSYGRQYDELGVLAMERGDPPKEVKPLFEKAVDLSADTKATAVNARGLQHRGDVSLALRDFPSAEKDFTQAFQAVKGDNNEFETIDAAAHLAKCYWLEGQKSKAVDTLKIAMDKRKNQNISRDLAKHAVELAYYCANTGKTADEKMMLVLVNNRIDYLDQIMRSGITCGGDAWKTEANDLRADARTITQRRPVQIDQLETCSPKFEYYRI